ncbi:hypothetical protein L209DRAFT_753179 [Thermothelomyces heterothallicus CBS 203.75]
MELSRKKRAPLWFISLLLVVAVNVLYCTLFVWINYPFAPCNRHPQPNALRLLHVS